MNTEETALTTNINEDQSTSNTVIPKSYPCPAITEGFVFEDAGDEEMKVETKAYPNGGKTKQVTLSDGRVARTRRVKGYEMIEAGKLADGSLEKVHAAVIAVSTTIDEKPIVIEDVLGLWGSDYSVLKVIANDLNF